jgi:DnaJ-class molecular chaperone
LAIVIVEIKQTFPQRRKIMRKECPTCLGLGLIPVLTPPMPCPDCKGQGYVDEDEDEDEDEDDDEEEA